MGTVIDSNIDARKALGAALDRLDTLTEQLDGMGAALRDIAQAVVSLNAQMKASDKAHSFEISRIVAEVARMHRDIVNSQAMTAAMPVFGQPPVLPQVAGWDPQWAEDAKKAQIESFMPRFERDYANNKWRGMSLTSDNAKQLLQNARSQDEAREILQAIRPN